MIPDLTDEQRREQLLALINEYIEQSYSGDLIEFAQFECGLSLPEYCLDHVELLGTGELHRIARYYGLIDDDEDTDNDDNPTTPTPA